MSESIFGRPVRMPELAKDVNVLRKHVQQEHLPECLNELGLWYIMHDIYSRYWPKHCRQCKGVGGFYGSYDPSDPGVKSLASGSMTDFDTCTICVDKGVCPRCGEEAINEDCTLCAACGFTFTYEESAPQKPECFCYEGLRSNDPLQLLVLPTHKETELHWTVYAVIQGLMQKVAEGDHYFIQTYMYGYRRTFPRVGPHNDVAIEGIWQWDNLPHPNAERREGEIFRYAYAKAHSEVQ